jgi:hypothetical protein
MSHSFAAAVVAGLLTTSTVTPVLTLQDPAITESSGLVRSVAHPGLLWTHNDGGTTADIYGLDRSGRTVAHLRLRGIDPYDPEALSRGRDGKGRPALFLGDIGDNDEQRPDVSVFRVTEPKALGDHTVDATWFRFRYPDRAHDAEALLVNPATGRIFIATKDFGTGTLYRAPAHLVTQEHGTNRLTPVGDVPPLVTDGAFIDGSRFVLRTYTSAYVYDRPGHLVQQLTTPIQEQGESIALDGNRLLLGSEGAHSQVLAIPLPKDLLPSATPSSGTSSGEQTGANAGRAATDGPDWTVLGLVGAGVVLLAALVARTVRRRRRG